MPKSSDDPFPYRDRGLRLRDARTRARMSQAEVARACGLKQQSVAGWESGKTSPQTRNLIILSRLYGVPERWILHGGARYDTRQELDAEKVLFLSAVISALARLPLSELVRSLEHLLDKDQGDDAGQPLIGGRIGGDSTPDGGSISDSDDDSHNGGGKSNTG